MIEEELYLPKELLVKSIKAGQELGWFREDFEYVVKSAYDLGIAIIGGQVQFYLPDGTCELYWHKYDTKPKETGENWIEYCNRTMIECLELFKKIPSNSELIKEGIECFKFLKDKNNKNEKFENYLIFIIYFKNKP